MTRRIRIFSTAAVAAALVTTLALARTTHTPTPQTEHASVAHGKVIGTTPNPNQSGGSHLHGIITCGATASAQDCERLEMLLPMNRRAPDNTAKQAVRI